MPQDALQLSLPKHCHNTVVSCLACLCDSLHLDLSFDEVAGLSGEAFRLPVFSGIAPGAWQHSVSWPHAALHWTQSLGIDAEICWTDAGGGGIDNWLERQRIMIRSTLHSGFPVMYWDNLAWSLILAEDADNYLVSGIPDIHLPQDLLTPGGLQQRCYGAAGHGEEGAFAMSHSAIRPLFAGDALFIHPRGRLPQDPEYRQAHALRRAADELAGNVRWPRQSDGKGERLHPLFGTQAMQYLAEQLRSGELSLGGLIETMQNLLEMRCCAQRFIAASAVTAPPELQARLTQAAEFLRRGVQELRPLANRFHPPADPVKQLERDGLKAAAEVLYEVRRTDETLTRLLRSIAADFGVFG